VRSEESVKTLDDEMMFQTKSLLFCLCERMKRKSVWSVLLKFGLSVGQKNQKKEKNSFVLFLQKRQKYF